MPIPYFDAHCDTVTKFRPLRACTDTHLDLKRLGNYAPSAQVLALWAPPGPDCTALFDIYMHRVEKELRKNEDIAMLCRSVEDLARAEAEGKIALLLAVEGARLLGCSITGLVTARRRGVRIVTLCWNKDNALCGAAKDSGSGLTEQGRLFVKACGNAGVAVDLSHASDQTFWDVLETAEKPPLCTHSDARALCDHCRNMTDDMIRALSQRGGVMGINLCPDFLGLGRDLDAVLSHIDHFLSLGAEKNLCLGTDFDGITSTPSGLSGVQDMAALYDALLARLPEDTVNGIFYLNLRRYLEGIL